jgi:isopentenyl-diphosphate delta-isomerase
MADRLRVFVSSTFADLRLEREYLIEVLTQMGLEPVLLPELSAPGDFATGFLRELDESHLVIYLVTRKSKAVDRELLRAKEIGLPVVELAQKPASRLARKRRESIPHQQGEFGNLHELRAKVEEGVATAISRRFAATSSMKFLGDDVYNSCQLYVDRAQRRLGIIQRTSSLILGPRRDRLEEEGRFLRALQKRLDGIKAGDDPMLEIAYLFHRDDTLRELRENASAYPHARDAIVWLRAFGEPAHAGIRVLPVSEATTPLVLMDSTLSLTATIGRNLWFEQLEAGRASLATWDQLVNVSESGPLSLRSVLEEAMSVLDSHDASETVELLHEDGSPAGAMAKKAAHERPGHLHRGFSVFLFDETRRTMLQRRAASKYHFAGKWSNACCSHPPASLSVEVAAKRRLFFELGIDTPLEVVGSFRYSAIDDASGLVELEDDTVLVGYIPSDVIVVPNPSEVSAFRLIEVTELENELKRSPEASTPWLLEALQCVVKAGHPRT